MVVPLSVNVLSGHVICVSVQFPSLNGIILASATKQSTHGGTRFRLPVLLRVSSDRLPKGSRESLTEAGRRDSSSNKP